MFRTLTAKYAGTCKRCRQAITPGHTIRYGGRGLTYHLSTDAACRPGRHATDDTDADTITQADADAQPDAPTFDRSQMADF